MQRCENLKHSVDELKVQLEEGKAALEDAKAALEPVGWVERVLAAHQP
jgi:hypothetical protein